MATSYTSPRGNPPPHPFANPAAGPSTFHHRQPSNNGYTSVEEYAENEGRGLSGDLDRVGDAEGDDGRRGSFDLRTEMMGFEPPPPRTMPQYQHAHQYRSPPQPPSGDYTSVQLGPRTPPQDPASSLNLRQSPRDRLSSSTSMSSVTSARGRSAPAPAALDLSPQSERRLKQAAAVGMGQDTYAAMRGLGYGQAPGYGLDSRRAVTDSSVESVRDNSAECVSELKQH